MGGANVTGMSPEQGALLVRELREEYEQHTTGDNVLSSSDLQKLMTYKYNKITDNFNDEESIDDSLTYSTVSADETSDMLKTLTLKGTHFLELMNFLESEGEPNVVVEDDMPPAAEVVDPWTKTMDMR